MPTLARARRRRASHALLGGALLLTAMRGSAQPPVAASAGAPAGGGAACSGVARTIALVVRRADGAPVTDASVTARAGDDGRVLARLGAASLPDGNYLVFTDERPPELRDGRGTVRLTVAWRGTTRRVRWTLGPDARGCHTVLLDGPQVVRFP